MFEVVNEWLQSFGHLATIVAVLGSAGVGCFHIVRRLTRTIDGVGQLHQKVDEGFQKNHGEHRELHRSIGKVRDATVENRAALRALDRECKFHHPRGDNHGSDS